MTQHLSFSAFSVKSGFVMAEEIQLAGDALSIFYCVITVEFLVNLLLSFIKVFKSS